MILLCVAAAVVVAVAGFGRPVLMNFHMCLYDWAVIDDVKKVLGSGRQCDAEGRRDAEGRHDAVCGVGVALVVEIVESSQRKVVVVAAAELTVDGSDWHPHDLLVVAE